MILGEVIGRVSLEREEDSSEDWETPSLGCWKVEKEPAEEAS